MASRSTGAGVNLSPPAEEEVLAAWNLAVVRNEVGHPLSSW